jgi:hypothetical protein
MPMGDFLDDAEAWLDDLGKPKVRPIVQMTPPDSTGYQAQTMRKNPVNGRDQILVFDPDHPGQMIWVDAQWNPLYDLMEPIDPKYRPKAADYYNVKSIIQSNRPFVNQFAGSGDPFNFSGLDLSVPADQNNPIGMPSLALAPPQAQGSNNGAVLALIAVVVVALVLSR